MADVQITLDEAAIQKLKDAAARALSQTGEELLSRARNAAVMPMDTGNLQNDSTHVDDSNVAEGHVDIVTDTSYGRRLYFHPEYDFRHDPNANAGGEWWEPWIGGEHKEDPAHVFAGLLKKNAGGLIK